VHLVQFKRLHTDALVPTKATTGAACYDLYSYGCIPDDRGYTVHTGLSIALPSNLGLLIFPRSGLSTKFGLTLRNVVGVIDSDYRGEIMIKFHQGNPNDQAEIRELLKYGNRVAQALIIELPTTVWMEVTDLPSTERGLGGFGSTGTTSGAG
jgi:dUTP pyrophosphatase